MIARLEVVASAILAASAPLLSLPLFEQSVPASKRNRLRSASRPKFAHCAFDINPYRLKGEAENRSDLISCLSGRDPTQTFALSRASADFAPLPRRNREIAHARPRDTREQGREGAQCWLRRGVPSLDRYARLLR